MGGVAPGSAVSFSASFSLSRSQGTSAAESQDSLRTHLSCSNRRRRSHRRTGEVYADPTVKGQPVYPTSAAAASVVAAKRKSSCVCAADTCVRMRALPSGTTG